MDAVFTGGNWNFEYFDKPFKGDVNVDLHPDYIKFLKSEGVKWVGISVGMYQDNVRDATVESYYPNGNNPGELGALGTMTDANLKYVLKQFQSQGFNVYMTTAFEPKDGKLENFTPRHMMGKDYSNEEVAQKYNQEDWLWDPSHPEHDEFVSNFWQSYTKDVVHYARIAKACGVDMFSLGTETDSLFHTEATESSQQTFEPYINRMIKSVRKQYDGLLTYDQHSDVVLYDHYYGGSDLWTSTSFDVIGISAYFPLLTEVHGVSSVHLLEKSWRNIFENTLKPLHEENPHKSIVFTEFGYTDSINSPVQYDADQFKKHKFIDANHNGLDDGQETQANIYKAFFNVNHDYGDLVAGVFPLSAGGHVTSDKAYNGYEKGLTGFPIRGKLAEKVFAHEYKNDDSVLAGSFGTESGQHMTADSTELHDFAGHHHLGSDFLI